MKKILNSFIVCLLSVIIVSCHNNENIESATEKKECCIETDSSGGEKKNVSCYFERHVISPCRSGSS